MASRIYLDTSPILSYLNNEGDKGRTMRSALDLAATDRSPVGFFTSVAAIIEVVHILEEHHVRPDSLATIDAFWDTAPITKVEINEISARECRSLMRFRYYPDGVRNRLPENKTHTIDAIHLAVARWLDCDQLWTYNPKHFEYFNQPPELPIREPHVDQLALDGI